MMFCYMVIIYNVDRFLNTHHAIIMYYVYMDILNNWKKKIDYI